MEYSTVGGNVSKTSLLINLFPSRLFNSLERVLSVMPGTSLDICLNRLLPPDSENKMSNFHLPSSASNASLMESAVFGHPPLDHIAIIYLTWLHDTITLDSAIPSDSAIQIETKCNRTLWKS